MSKSQKNQIIPFSPNVATLCLIWILKLPNVATFCLLWVTYPKGTSGEFGGGGAKGAIAEVIAQSGKIIHINGMIKLVRPLFGY